MCDSISCLTAAATALDALDVMADVASQAPLLAPLATEAPPPPPLPALAAGASVLGPNTGCQDLPAPGPILRQIRDDYWDMGEQYLESHPNEDEVQVFFHHWNENMRWEYKVVRVADGFQHQTWLNGVLMG